MTDLAVTDSVTDRHGVGSKGVVGGDMAYSVPAIERIKRRLAEAADTLKRLPAVRCFPAHHMTGWPDIVRSVYEAYGYAQAEVRLPPPLPAAIDDMERIIALTMARLDDDERWLVWAKACRRGDYEIAKRLKCSRTTIWRRWLSALAKMT